MIPKFICFILGHNFYMNVFTGKTEVVTNAMVGDMIVPITRRQEQIKCLRCNARNPDALGVWGSEQVIKTDQFKATHAARPQT